MDQLPEYVQICHRAVLEIFEEFERELAKQGRSCLVFYAKEAVPKIQAAALTDIILIYLLLIRLLISCIVSTNVNALIIMMYFR